MILYLFLSFYALLVIANILLFKKNKSSTLVIFLSLMFILVIMGGNTSCADYEDYEALYDYQDYPIFWEPGYVFLSNYCSSLGMPFIFFRFVLLSFSIFLFFATIRRVANNYHLFFLVYMSVLFVLDTIQIRNTMAVSLLFCSLVYLSRGKKIHFVIYILLSFLFHFSFVVFLPLLFYKKIIIFEKKRRKKILLISSVLSLITASGSLLFFGNIVMLVNESKVEYINSRWFNLFYLLLPFLFYLVASKSRLFLKETGAGNNIKFFSDVVYAIGVLFIIYMPVLALSHEFARIIRDAGVEIVALVGIVFTYKSDILLCYNNMAWRKYKFLLLLFLTTWLTGIQYWQGYEEIFFNNILY